MKKFKIIILTILGILVQSCSKDESPVNPTPSSNNNITLPEIITHTTILNPISQNPGLGGNITSDGGSPITARGIVWSTNLNPTLSNSKTSDGTGTGPFNSVMTGLSSLTRYYVKAYATNSNGTKYGNEVSFTTANFNLNNTPALMTANINGVQFNNMQPFWYASNQIDVSIIDTINTFYLEIEGSENPSPGNSATRRTINLYIPQNKWVVGNYSFMLNDGYFDASINACQAKIVTNGTVQKVTSGSIAVTEFNTVTKRIKGTFSFGYITSVSSPVYQVLNGTFNYALDDPYFN